jgi:hypothetical protein
MTTPALAEFAFERQRVSYSRSGSGAVPFVVHADLGATSRRVAPPSDSLGVPLVVMEPQ